jgi:hypothetical protein
MIDYFVSIWAWFKNSALHQLIFAILLSALIFFSLSKYPITLEIKSSSIKDLIDIEKDTTYVIHSEITEQGAKLFVNTQTYFTQVNK